MNPAQSQKPSRRGEQNAYAAPALAAAQISRLACLLKMHQDLIDALVDVEALARSIHAHGDQRILDLVRDLKRLQHFAAERLLDYRASLKST
jgi:hypothetical protein